MSENEKLRALRQAIDAVLAEPSEDYERLCQNGVRCQCGDDEACQFARERDEARAAATTAYQRGAEAMREAAAREIDRLLTQKKATAIWVAPDEIRALPVPKEEP